MKTKNIVASLMTKEIVTFALSAALIASAVAMAWADAPASPLSQAETIMGAQASSETKLDVLYNGASVKQLVLLSDINC